MSSISISLNIQSAMANVLIGYLMDLLSKYYLPETYYGMKFQKNEAW